MSTTEEQAAAALKAADPVLLATGARTATAPAPAPDETWQLPGGTAWVHYGEGHQGLVRPVLMADGFNTGPSDLDLSWEHLNRRGFPLLDELRRRRRDVVLVGYDERSASILDNARVATAAIDRALAQRLGGERLVVGGFSMGGLVTRYALAKLEDEGIDHQTAVYFSWDSPHTGAWIPLSLQAFAHYIRKLDSRFSDQINSPAAQQLLWRHLSHWEDKPGPSPLRTDFLDRLQEVGNWPRLPRLLALSNGPGDGSGNGIRPGVEAVVGKGHAVYGTELRTQSEGDDELVAKLRVVTVPTREVRTSGLPDIDGAPGGTLDGFGILADELDKLAPILGFAVENPVRAHCFVPAVSAVAVREPGNHADLYLPIDELAPDESPLDDFVLASRNEEHTLITEELSSWLLDRLP
ncbi:lipase family protein [Streptomyces sp. DB-54]